MGLINPFQTTLTRQDTMVNLADKWTGPLSCKVTRESVVYSTGENKPYPDDEAWNRASSTGEADTPGAIVEEVRAVKGSAGWGPVDLEENPQQPFGCGHLNNCLGLSDHYSRNLCPWSFGQLWNTNRMHLRIKMSALLLMKQECGTQLGLLCPRFPPRDPRLQLRSLEEQVVTPRHARRPACSHTDCPQEGSG